MDRIRAFILRLRSLLRRESASEAVGEEVRYHIERQVEENIARGMSPEEARRDAQMEFGSVPQVTEECARANGISWLQDFVQDLRYGLRTLRKSPAFTVVAVLTLAIGIGACTAIFSLVNAVLIRSLPYGNSARLVYLFTPNRHFDLPPEVFDPSNEDFFDFQQESHSYTRMAIFNQSTYSLAAHGAVERIGAALVNENFFSTLESPPELGRAIQSEDTQPGHSNVAIISHALWQSMFGGAYDILTKSLLLDGKSYRIIGVMPPTFQYPNATDLHFGNSRIKATHVWVPLVLTPQERADRDEPSSYVIARLKPGISIAQAQAEASAIVSRLDRLHSAEWQGSTALLRPFNDMAVGSIRPLMWLLLGAVCFVLLIACSNAANLLLARAASRTYELGVRATLGAGRSRMIRQMLAESLLLGLAGGTLGTALAYIFLRVLLRLDPGNIPRLNEATLDLRVLLFTLGMSLLTSILFGLLPAFAASRINLVEFLKSGGSRGVVGTHNHLRDGLVIAEVGLAVVLLAGAGLLLRSYARLASVSPGFSQSTITMNLQLDSRYARPEDSRALFRNLINKINAAPGVTAVGAINYLPLSNSESMSTFEIDGSANQKDQLVESRDTTPGYFSAMGIPLIAGRFFKDSDDGNAPPVVIINQRFAKEYFAGRDPIGKRLRNPSQVRDPAQDNTPWSTVIGVVADVRHSSMEEAAAPQMYSPFWQGSSNGGYIAVRSPLSENAVTAEVRNIIKTIDPTLALADIHTMGELISEANAKRSFQTTLLTVFAGVALFLALVGIYGLLSYSVKQRSAEIGVRLALGAPRSRVLGMILQQGLRLVLVGSVLGLAGAFALTRLLASSLYEVRALDPLTLIAVPFLLIVVAIAACVIPGWMAARINPIEALRYE